MRLVFFFVVLACTPSPAPAPRVDPPAARADAAAARADAAAAARTPAVPPGSPHYDLFEGTSYKNDCTADKDCHAGGCSHEVCSAEGHVMSPCIVHPDQPRDATCGCVSGQCIWYR
jgi:eight-cysteine-cluster-containing protein